MAGIENRARRSAEEREVLSRPHGGSDVPFQTYARRSAVCSVNSKAVRRPAILLGAALSLAFSAGASASRDLWDPVPAADAGKNELSLPMPCGGKMVFRRIETAAKGPLDDVRITVGSDDRGSAAVDTGGTTYIGGSFSSKGGRSYWLGKYEVTQAQYDAVMSDGKTCPPQGDLPMPKLSKLAVPVVKVSWYDAVEFTRKYNEWLNANAADALPKEDGQPGFVRLPTGTEWEYAARGGIAGVTGRDAPENADEVAWSSPKSNGRLQLVGLKKPDASGLFDMLGNVSEITFSPFALSKVSRPHGQASGFESRGGNYQTAGSGLFYGLRTEHGYYSGGKEFRAKTLGFRAAVGALALTSDKRLQEIKKEWDSLGNDSNAGDTHGGNAGTVKKISELEQKLKRQEEILKKNRELTEANRDLQESGSTREKELADLQGELAGLRESLVAVQKDLKSANMARDEQRDSAIVANIQLGAFLCSRIADQNIKLDNRDRFNAMRKDMCKDSSDSSLCTPEQLKKLDDDRAQVKAVLDSLTDYYRSTIKGTAGNYDLPVMESQREKSLLYVSKMPFSNLTGYASIYLDHLKAAYGGSGDQDRKWISDCTSLAAGSKK